MIVIALGANLPSGAGAPRETLRAALDELFRRGVGIGAVSAYYTTKAWPNPADPPFVNAVASIETALLPAELMKILHQVEAKFGRRRAAKNAPRTLDLDLLDYDGRIESGPPSLPHPRLSERGFVLVPLEEIAPGWRHPVTGQTVAGLIAALPPDARDVRRLTD